MEPRGVPWDPMDGRTPYGTFDGMPDDLTKFSIGCHAMWYGTFDGMPRDLTKFSIGCHG